jgi:hypothetical protein
MTEAPSSTICRHTGCNKQVAPHHAFCENRHCSVKTFFGLLSHWWVQFPLMSALFFLLAFHPVWPVFAFIALMSVHGIHIILHSRPFERRLLVFFFACAILSAFSPWPFRAIPFWVALGTAGAIVPTFSNRQGWTMGKRWMAAILLLFVFLRFESYLLYGPRGDTLGQSLARITAWKGSLSNPAPVRDLLQLTSWLLFRSFVVLAGIKALGSKLSEAWRVKPPIIPALAPFSRMPHRNLEPLVALVSVVFLGALVAGLYALLNPLAVIARTAWNSFLTIVERTLGLMVVVLNATIHLIVRVLAIVTLLFYSLSTISMQAIADVFHLLAVGLRSLTVPFAFMVLFVQVALNTSGAVSHYIEAGGFSTVLVKCLVLVAASCPILIVGAWLTDPNGDHQSCWSSRASLLTDPDCGLLSRTARNNLVNLADSAHNYMTFFCPGIFLTYFVVLLVADIFGYRGLGPYRFGPPIYTCFGLIGVGALLILTGRKATVHQTQTKL